MSQKRHRFDLFSLPTRYAKVLRFPCFIALYREPGRSGRRRRARQLEQDHTHNITYFIRQPEFIAYLDARHFGEPLILRRTVEVQGGVPAEQIFSVQLAPYGDEQKLLLSRDSTQIERLETVRRDFVANVSHELRTPLTVMAGFLETLNTSGIPDEALLQRSLAHMTAQSDRMRRLVEDLLTLSRLEDEAHRLIEAPIDVPQLINALIIDAETLSQQRHALNGTLLSG